MRFVCVCVCVGGGMTTIRRMEGCRGRDKNKIPSEQMEKIVDRRHGSANCSLSPLFQLLCEQER